MKNLKTIARKLGVSIAAVSLVANDRWREQGLSERTALRIRKCIAREQYRPNRLAVQLRTGRSHMVGIILGDLTRHYSLQILAGIESVLAANDYFAVVCNSRLGAHEENNLEMLREQRVDGILLAPQQAPANGGALGRLLKEQMPVVFVDNYLPRSKISFIVSDNFWGTYQATKWLVKKGCKTIAYLGSEKPLVALSDRFHGYRQALKDHALPIGENLIERTMIEPEDAVVVLKRLFSKESPDALFVESLPYFREGFRFLADRQTRVPEDIAVTGFDPVNADGNDDLWGSVLKSPIPFIEQDGFEVGQQAAQLLLRKITGKGQARIGIFVKPKLRYFEKTNEK